MNRSSGMHALHPHQAWNERRIQALNLLSFGSKPALFPLCSKADCTFSAGIPMLVQKGCPSHKPFDGFAVQILGRVVRPGVHKQLYDIEVPEHGRVVDRPP